MCVTSVVCYCRCLRCGEYFFFFLFSGRDWNGSGGEVWMGGQEEVIGDGADMEYVGWQQH